MAALNPLQLYIYAEARRMFALGLWSWPALVMRAYLLGEDYVPNLEDETTLELVTPILASTNLTGPQTDSHGFNTIDPIVFLAATLPEPAASLVIATDNGIPALFSSFPLIAASAGPANIPVLLSTEWLFRL